MGRKNLIPDDQRSRSLQWYHENHERLRERRNALMRQRYRENPEKFKQYCKKWRAAHPEYARTSDRAGYSRRWRKKNPEKVAAHGRKQRYGITPEHYERLLLQQSGKCKICGDFMNPVAVDHNHITGAIRGLLCKQCNFGLGSFKDNPQRLRAAAAYLEETQCL